MACVTVRPVPHLAAVPAREDHQPCAPTHSIRIGGARHGRCSCSAPPRARSSLRRRRRRATAETPAASRADVLDLGARTWTRSSRSGTPTHPDIQVTVNKQDGGDPAVTKLLTAIKAGKRRARHHAGRVPEDPDAGERRRPRRHRRRDRRRRAVEVRRRGPGRGHARQRRASTRVPQDVGAAGVLLPRRRLREARPRRPDHLGRVRRGRPHDPPGAARHLPRHLLRQRRRLVRRALPAGRRLLVGRRRRRLGGRHRRRADPAGRRLLGRPGRGGRHRQQADVHPGVERRAQHGTQVGWVSAVWAPGVLGRQRRQHRRQVEDGAAAAVGRGEPATGNWGGSATGVTTQSKHPEQAAEFIAWLNTDPEAVKALVDQAGIYPADQPTPRTALDRAAGLLLQPAGLLHRSAAEAATRSSRSPTVPTSTSPTAPTTTSSARPPRAEPAARSPTRSPPCRRRPSTTSRTPGSSVAE